MNNPLADLTTVPSDILSTARLSFEAFAFAIQPGFECGPHHRLIIRRVEDLLRGRIKKLIVVCPPRQALNQLKRAEAEMDISKRKLQEFVSANFQIVAGGLIYFSHHDREMLDETLKDLTEECDKASVKFQSALSKWAEL